MKRGASSAKPGNPLVGDNDEAETINRVHSVAQYVAFTAPDLVRLSSNEAATDGLSLIMDMVVAALESCEGVRRGI